MSQNSSDWNRALATKMQIARRDANWRKSWNFGFSDHEHAREIGFIHGMTFAAMFHADDCLASDIARDAFTAAQNELNFLFGRYQERT